MDTAVTDVVRWRKPASSRKTRHAPSTPAMMTIDVVLLSSQLPEPLHTPHESTVALPLHVPAQSRVALEKQKPSQARCADAQHT